MGRRDALDSARLSWRGASPFPSLPSRRRSVDAKTDTTGASKSPYREESEFHRAHQHQSASAVLRAVIDEAEGETISIGAIIEAFGERAFGFVLILFSLPNCVPAPPGIAGIVG